MQCFRCRVGRSFETQTESYRFLFKEVEWTRTNYIILKKENLSLLLASIHFINIIQDVILRSTPIVEIVYLITRNLHKELAGGVY